MSAKRSTILIKQIEQDIITGILRPGEKLSEEALCQRFEVSRTPVREALLKLSSTGLVEILPRRGARVMQIGLKNLLEMFELMAELEAMCGSWAATRMSQAEVIELRQFHEATAPMVDADKFDEYYEANVLFHESIYNGSQNTYLAKQTMNLRNRLAPYRRMQLHQQNRIQMSYDEHEKVTQAIEAHDSELAASLLKQHVTAQQGSLSSFISSLSMDLVSSS